MHSTSQ